MATTFRRYILKDSEGRTVDPGGTVETSKEAIQLMGARWNITGSAIYDLSDGGMVMDGYIPYREEDGRILSRRVRLEIGPRFDPEAVYHIPGYVLESKLGEASA